MQVRQFNVYMSPAAQERVTKTLYSGYIGQGPLVDQFEAALCLYFDMKNLIAVNSGTSALQLALHLIKPHPGSTILTTPLTCWATTTAILNAGFEPLWVDIDPETCNIDLNDLQQMLNHGHPAGIMLVHYAGYPVDLKVVNKIARGLQVIEDCAHAFGAYTPDGYVGSGLFGNYGCFSFQAIKTLTTGDGGALVVPDDEQYQRAKKLRWFGLERDKPRQEQDIIEAGFKYHMNDITASIGLANIYHVAVNLAKQRSNVEHYRYNLPWVAPKYKLGFGTSGWMYPVQVGDAQAFNHAMKSRGIETGLGHERNDLHTCVKEFRRDLPGLEKTIQSTSCIPSGWWLTEEERGYVVDCVKYGW